MKIDKGTLARTICLALALINQVLAILGKGTIDIADDTIYQLVTIAWTTASAIYAWWKNNDFTTEAKIATAYMKNLKSTKNMAGGENNIEPTESEAE